MVFTWRYENASGEPVQPTIAIDGEDGTFADQGDAETWFGENWPTLLAAEVDQVTLLEDGEPVYGPMSLHEDPPA